MSSVNYNARLPDFLPGRLVLGRGSARDYQSLAAFHYAAGPPATWAAVWVVRYVEKCVGVSACGCVGVNPARTLTPRYADTPTQSAERTVAVAVLSYPVPSCRPRERWFGLRGTRNENLRFANANLRTISRVVVHPQFRALGLSTLLVRCLCAHGDTRYVEAIAQMGHVHPLFTRAGMIRTNLDHPDEPAYFMLDREAEAQIAPARRAA